MILKLSVGLSALILSAGLMKQALLLLLRVESLAMSVSHLRTRIMDNYCLELSGMNHELRQCLLLLLQLMSR